MEYFLNYFLQAAFLRTTILSHICSEGLIHEHEAEWWAVPGGNGKGYASTQWGQVQNVFLILTLQWYTTIKTQRQR